MAQWVREERLLCKNEDLSSNVQHTLETDCWSLLAASIILFREAQFQGNSGPCQRPPKVLMYIHK